MSPFGELFEGLDGLGVTSTDVTNLSPHSLDMANDLVSAFFEDHVEEIAGAFLGSGGNKLVFYDADGIVSSVAKKALVYSERTLFVSQSSLRDETEYWFADSDGHMVLDHKRSGAPKSLIPDLLSLRELLIAGACSYLPSNVTRENDSRQYEPGDPGDGPNTVKGVDPLPPELDFHTQGYLTAAGDPASPARLESTHAGLLHVLSTNAALSAQLSEDNDQCGVSVRLYLPHLSGVSSDTLLQLRAEEGDAFADLQHSLKRFFYAEPSVDGAQSLLEAMESVDFEVRALKKRLRKLQQRRRIEAMSLALTTVGLTSLYVLPNETAQLISQAVGVTTIPAILRDLATGRSSRRDVQDSDFYFALRASG